MSRGLTAFADDPLWALVRPGKPRTAAPRRRDPAEGATPSAGSSRWDRMARELAPPPVAPLLVVDTASEWDAAITKLRVAAGRGSHVERWAVRESARLEAARVENEERASLRRGRSGRCW